MFTITLVGFLFCGSLLTAAALHPWYRRRKVLRKLRKRG